MKIAISSTGKDLNSQVDPRFGRCAYFIIIDTDDMSFDAFENGNIALSGGVGIQSASYIISKGVKAVLTGNCGPKAMQTFSAGAVEVFTGLSGTVKEVVERYKNEDLHSSTQATVAEKAGVNRSASTGNYQRPGVGRCMGGAGRGMGMGRGMAMGGGRGMGRGFGGCVQGLANQAIDGSLENTTLTDLKKQSADLQKQMEQIQTKTNNMEQ
jgi:predicted Fe-Mo cluster-binding NifX family protein